MIWLVVLLMGRYLLLFSVRFKGVLSQCFQSTVQDSAKLWMRMSQLSVLSDGKKKNPNSNVKIQNFCFMPSCKVFLKELQGDQWLSSTL